MSTSVRTNGEVALVAYPGCSLVELIGAQCVWATASMFSTLRTVVVGPTRDFIPSSTPLYFRPQKTFAEVPHPEVLIVVGGVDATGPASEDPELLAYVRDAAAGATVAGTVTVTVANPVSGGEDIVERWSWRL